MNRVLVAVLVVLTCRAGKDDGVFHDAGRKAAEKVANVLPETASRMCENQFRGTAEFLWDRSAGAVNNIPSSLQSAASAGVSMAHQAASENPVAAVAVAVGTVGVAVAYATKDYFFPKTAQQLQDARNREELTNLQRKRELRECLENNSSLIGTNCDFRVCDRFIRNYTMVAGRSAARSMLEDYRSVYGNG